MATNLNLTPSNIQSGNAVVGTYRRGHVDIPINPVEEYILIETGAIAAGVPKLIDLNVLDYEVRIYSIWILSGTNPARPIVTFQIVACDAVNTPLTEVEIEGNCGEHSVIPYIVTHKRYCYRVVPSINVTNLLIFCKPVVQLDYVGIV